MGNSNRRFHSVPGREYAGRVRLRTCNRKPREKVFFVISVAATQRSFVMADGLYDFDMSTGSYDYLTTWVALAVDEMNDERLILLGDRMGRVCAGIPEEKIPLCLTVKEFSDHSQETSCVICLEEYKTKDDIAAINKCGHEYHASCITKWLQMKKTCPVCRREAF